jgi:hypothetical protein
LSARRLFRGALAETTEAVSASPPAFGGAKREAGSRRGRTIASPFASPITAAEELASEAARRGAGTASGERRAATLALGRFGGGWFDGGAVVGLAFPVGVWFPFCFCFCFCFSADAASAGAVVLGAESGAGVAPSPFALSPRKSVRP